MAALLSPADLAPFATIESAKAQAMIDDVLALAGLAAPCLFDEPDLDVKKAKAAKAILRGVVLRWNDAGPSGRRTQESETIGPWQHTETIDNGVRRSLLFPTEITALQALCADGKPTRKAWSYDTAGGGGIQHAATCGVNLGATFCDCGAILTGAGPLWGPDAD